jgi:hypothetical protein
MLGDSDIEWTPCDLDAKTLRSPLSLRRCVHVPGEAVELCCHSNIIPRQDGRHHRMSKLTLASEANM